MRKATVFRLTITVVDLRFCETCSRTVSSCETNDPQDRRIANCWTKRAVFSLPAIAVGCTVSSLSRALAGLWMNARCFNAKDLCFSMNARCCSTNAENVRRITPESITPTAGVSLLSSSYMTINDRVCRIAGGCIFPTKKVSLLFSSCMLRKEETFLLFFLEMLREKKVGLNRVSASLGAAGSCCGKTSASFLRTFPALRRKFASLPGLLPRPRSFFPTLENSFASTRTSFVTLRNSFASLRTSFVCCIPFAVTLRTFEAGFPRNFSSLQNSFATLEKTPEGLGRTFVSLRGSAASGVFSFASLLFSSANLLSRVGSTHQRRACTIASLAYRRAFSSVDPVL